MSLGSQSVVTAAVLRQQVALYVVGRLGARLWLVLSPLGWANSATLRVLVALFAVYDLALATALRRGRGPSLRVRWIMDVTDVTLWAVLCPASAPYSAAAVVAQPLLIVTAVRRGAILASLAGLGLVGIVATARLVRHEQPFVSDALLYAGASVVLGTVLGRLMRRESERQRELAQTLAEADLVAATLAGRNDVVTGAGAEAIDDLQTSIMKLTAAHVDAATTLRAAIGRHKQILGERTRAEAMYLRDALDSYAAAVRSGEPTVAKHVFFDVAPSAGVCVLDRSQSEQLTAALAAGDFAGVVPVQVLQSQRDGQLVLQAGPSRLILTGRHTRVWLPLAPVATTAFASYVLTLSNGNYTGVPLQVTLPLAVMVLGYAVAELLLIHRFGPHLEPWLAVGTIVPFGLIAVLAARAATVRGPHRLVLVGILVGLAMLMGTVIRPRVAALAARTALVVATVVVVASSPGLSARFVAAELIWPTIGFLGAFFIARGMIQLSSQLSDQLSGDGKAMAARARRTAAGSELDYLLDVLSQGEALCAVAEIGPVRAQVATELGRLRQHLQRLRLEAA